MVAEQHNRTTNVWKWGRRGDYDVTYNYGGRHMGGGAAATTLSGHNLNITYSGI